jgi:hypothetical protein
VLLAAARGDRLSRDDVRALERRLATIISTHWRRVMALTWLAAMYARTGDPDEGLRLVTPLRQQGGCFTPEVLRIEGELTLQRDPAAAAAAERCFTAAIADARARQERTLELRAATSLARLWHAQGKAADARAMLGAVYGTFTEGFTTADVIAAKELLAAL